MKRFKIIPLTFLLTLFAFSLLNINLTLAGWQTDTTGDADGIGSCDITKTEVEVTYYSHPTDDVIILFLMISDCDFPSQRSKR